jgi:hypothetical protein
MQDMEYVAAEDERSPVPRRAQIEQVVLEMVLELHPDHLTSDELILEVANEQDRSEQDDVRNAIRDLKGSGLLRHVDEGVMPTRAALRAGALLR